MWGGVTFYYEFINPHVKLLNTFIHELKECDINNRIYMKRDDFISLSFGGNKARKALYFFKEIDEKGYDYVVTYGSSSSNHCCIISNMAAARNLPCIIIESQETLKMTFNSQMMNLFGAEIITVPINEVHNTIESTLDNLRKDGKNPYFIQGGGHGFLGTQAYVDCYREIKEYEMKHDIHFDYIFFASGTGTTQAGLVCGKIMSKDDSKIIGISIARKAPYGRDVVVDSVREYMNEIGYKAKDDEINENVIFIDNYIGDGYGKANNMITKTIKDVLIRYGIPLDTTYTGKAFYGMLQYLKEHGIKNKNVLFIHTGGTPLFFDDLINMKK